MKYLDNLYHYTQIIKAHMARYGNKISYIDDVNKIKKLIELNEL